MTVSRRTSSPGCTASSAATAAWPGGPSPIDSPSRHAVSGPSTASHNPLPCPAGAPPATGRAASPAAASAPSCRTSRPSAWASASSDPRRGRLLRPCSRSRTAATLSPDRCASCRCVRPAARRCSRTKAPSRAPAALCTPPITTIPSRFRASPPPSAPEDRAGLQPTAPSIAPAAVNQYCGPTLSLPLFRPRWRCRHYAPATGLRYGKVLAATRQPAARCPPHTGNHPATTQPTRGHNATRNRGRGKEKARDDESQHR
jgi:hypothetical protein